jgi:hypothetical protein
VEAGDLAPFPWSGREWGCWPVVGGRRPPVVDTWTNRPLCTEVIASPPRVPAVSLGCPQVMRIRLGDPGGALRAPGRGQPTPRAPAGRPCRSARRARPAGTGPPVRREGSGTPRRSPDVTWQARDLPNLCTFLGTTSRCVDGGDRQIAQRDGVGSRRRRCRLLHTPVDRTTTSGSTVGPSEARRVPAGTTGGAQRRRGTARGRGVVRSDDGVTAVRGS